MASPLLILFVFQVILAIIDSVGVDVLNELAWTLYNALPLVPKAADGQRENQIRKEVLRLQAEIKATSAQDDFAKWAKLRRQFDKKSEEYKTLTGNTSASKTTFTSRLNTLRWVSTNGFKLYMQWSYSREPMYWLPAGWLPWYGEWILSFPRAPLGAVSIQVWTLACSAVVGLVTDAVRSALVMATFPKAGNGNGAKEKAKADRSQ